MMSLNSNMMMIMMIFGVLRHFQQYHGDQF